MKNKTLSKILSVFLAVAMVLCAAPLSGFVGLKFPEINLPQWNLFDFSVEADAATYSGSCGDNVNWSLNTETGVLNITGTGAMLNYSYYSNAPWYSYRSYIKKVNIADGVTNIGSYAFYNCDSLTSVTIPDSVTSIGNNAFRYCDSLTSVTIPDSVTSIGGSAFYYCDSLTSVTIGDSVTSIGSYAFEYCKSLISVTIPDSVTSIGVWAFGYCDSLTSVTIGDSVTSIGDYAFYSCYSLTSVTIGDSVASIGSYAFYSCKSLTSVTIPDSVTSIGDHAFENCYSLTSVTIGDSVTSIGDYAFRYCDSLTSVTIPDSVTSIGDHAFENCDSLTSVTIPDSVTSIGGSAFSSCYSLTSVTIPDSVTSIGDWAFSNCYSLTSVTIPDSVTSIGNNAFIYCYSLTSITVDSDNQYYSSDEYGALYNKDKKTLIQYPIGNSRETFEIPDSVTSIGEYAFSDCDSLTSVTIPDSVTNIGGSAFSDCYSLTSVTIPDSVTSIGAGAFSDCDSLTSVTIPDSVTSIGSYAFADCDSLTSVTIPDSVTSIGDYAFFGCDSLTSVTIPDSVTSIGGWAFEYCKSLTLVTIPDSVTSIGEGAFYNCENLTDVYYNGTEEEWNEITIGSYNEDLLNATIHFAETSTPAESFEYTIENSEVTITKYIGSDTEVAIPSEIEGYPVTSIGNYAFKDCTSLKSITIPDSVTSIGDYTFSFCTKLGTVKIPDSVTSIGRSAFTYCKSLPSITIPDSVTSIGGDAFYECTGLSEVYYTGDIESWCNISFDGSTATPMCYANNFYINNTLVKEIVIPDTVTEIKNCTFYSFERITSVTIPDSVKSIGNRAFQDCTSLKSVTIGNSVTNIGDSAFLNCTSLTSVTIGNSVTSIGNYAFYNCIKLKEITMPVSAKIYNSSYTFGSCTKIEKVTLTKGTGVMQDYGTSSSGSSTTTYYQYTPWYKSRNTIKEVVIEEGVTNIGNYAFYGCTGLTSIEFPESIITIRESAFYNCTELTSIEIPLSIISIRENAFYGCNNISSVTYEGSEAQWDEIAIYDGNDCLEIAGKTFLHKGFDHEYTLYSVTDPTCTENGEKVYKCVYGDTYTELIPALGHTPSETVEENRTEPTCTADGSYQTVVYCSVCKFELSRETIAIPTSGHGEKIVASETAPTCTEIGLRNYKCSVCGLTAYEEKVYATNECPQSSHNYSNNTNNTQRFSSPGATKLILKFSSSTSVESNYDYIYIYNKDGSLYGKYTGTTLAGKTIDLSGDSFSIKLTSDSSQTYYGYSFDSITAVIGVDPSYKEVIPALGHTPSETVEENRTEPTCTEDGSYDTVVYCSVCKFELSRETIAIPTSGHGEKIVASETAPTCTETGLRIYKCSVCGVTPTGNKVYATNECPQSPHNYSDSTDFTKSFSSPGATKLILKFSSQTQTESGYDYIYIYNKDGSLYGKYTGETLAGKTIELSGDSFSIRLTSDYSNPYYGYYGYSFESITAVIGVDPSYKEVIPAAGHRFGAWVVTVEPTLTENGVKVKKCTVCGVTETGVEPKTGITITLTNAEGSVIKEEVIAGNLTEYTFTDIADGEYTVNISKETYVDNQYAVTVTGNTVSFDLKLNKVGDITGDGKVNTIDVARANAHAKSVTKLSGYQLACADVNGDGKVNTIDVARMNSHAKNVSTLW